MTKITDPPETPVDPVEAVDPVDVPETPTEPENGPEAAKYRRRLRDAEAERDGLAAKVETMQRAEVERMLVNKLSNPPDCWLLEKDLSRFLGETGDIDPALVKAFADETTATRPGWRPRNIGAPGGPMSTSPLESTSWQEVVRGR